MFQKKEENQEGELRQEEIEYIQNLEHASFFENGIDASDPLLDAITHFLKHYEYDQTLDTILKDKVCNLTVREAKELALVLGELTDCIGELEQRSLPSYCITGMLNLKTDSAYKTTYYHIVDASRVVRDIVAVALLDISIKDMNKILGEGNFTHPSAAIKDYVTFINDLDIYMPKEAENKLHEIVTKIIDTGLKKESIDQFEIKRITELLVASQTTLTAGQHQIVKNMLAAQSSAGPEKNSLAALLETNWL